MLPLQFFTLRKRQSTKYFNMASSMIVSPISDETPVSLVYAQASSALDQPSLEDNIRADVAIVGAGFTGLSTALHLAQQKVSVVVVERRHVGWGGSGRAFGQVVPYAKHHEDHIYTTFGNDYGERLISALAGGPDLVFGLIEKHKMECEAVRAGLLFAAHTEGAAKRLERRAKFWQARFQPVELVEAKELERIVGSPYYPVALLDRRGGVVNPFAYAQGLAKAVINAGGKLFENSLATSLARNGKGWRVTAGKGAIDADTIVLATDAYTDGLWPGLAGSIVPIRAYHLVSSLLSENLRRSILPGGQSLTDSRRLYSGIRVRPDGRLHMSVDGPPFSNRGRAFMKLGTDRVSNLFPQASTVTWEEQIAGWVGVSVDQYPRVHRLSDSVYAAIGLSGRGIAFGTLLGQELTRRVLRRPECEYMMPLAPLRPFPSPIITRQMVHGLIWLYRVLDRIELNSGYVRPASAF
jgi:glycine/D-amino acid oxidase-like deaminating enzyme